MPATAVVVGSGTDVVKIEAVRFVKSTTASVCDAESHWKS
jgi:hypothetical protein